MAFATDRSAHHKSLPVNWRAVLVGPACRSRKGPSKRNVSSAFFGRQETVRIADIAEYVARRTSAWVVSFTKGNDGFGSIQAMRKSYMAVVKLGFFTRLLERVGAADRYRFAA